jgi:hypothetical protein
VRLLILGAASRLDAHREVFLGSMGLLTSPKSARRQVSGTWCADLPTHRPTPLPRDNHRPVELPSCVTPSACLLPVWVTRLASSPRRARRPPALSIAGLGMGASKRQGSPLHYLQYLIGGKFVQRRTNKTCAFATLACVNNHSCSVRASIFVSAKHIAHHTTKLPRSWRTASD